MPTVEQLRGDLDELVRLALIDLDVLWRQVADAVVARDLLAEIMNDLTATYGAAAGTVAADWYDELRDELRITGRFTALTAPTAPPGQVDAAARWAVKNLFAEEPDFAGSLTNAQGATQRLITNVARDTIIGSTIEDPRAHGWQRSASGGCGFCRMLASRGAVYTAATVEFGAHDHCRCQAVPAFEGRPIPVKPFTPSPRTVTDADRARTRQWMAEHGY